MTLSTQVKSSQITTMEAIIIKDNHRMDLMKCNQDVMMEKTLQHYQKKLMNLTLYLNNNK
jgi:hypothetical protein